MSPPYKQCPFCDEVFDIGATDHALVERHVRSKHRDEGREIRPADEEGRTRAWTDG